MKKIISLLLCLVLIASFAVGVSADQGVDITTTVPQVKCTISDGGEKYAAYLGGERVDGKTVSVDRNVAFTISVEPAEGNELKYVYLNDKKISSGDGKNYTITLSDDENLVEIHIKDSAGIRNFFLRIVDFFRNLFSGIFN